MKESPLIASLCCSHSSAAGHSCLFNHPYELRTPRFWFTLFGFSFSISLNLLSISQRKCASFHNCVSVFRSVWASEILLRHWIASFTDSIDIYRIDNHSFRHLILSSKLGLPIWCRIFSYRPTCSRAWSYFPIVLSLPNSSISILLYLLQHEYFKPWPLESHLWSRIQPTYKCIPCGWRPSCLARCSWGVFGLCYRFW